MFNDLLQLFFTFGINLPPELSTFFRALITLEGTLTTLSPGYPVIDRAARVSLFSDPHDEQVVTKLVNRTVLALTGGVVGLIGAILIGVKGGPPFAGDTTLYEFFGYFSLFCSVVLIMRVIVSVLHDGVN